MEDAVDTFSSKFLGWSLAWKLSSRGFEEADRIGNDKSANVE